MTNTKVPRGRARREPMSRVDTAWLRMERPTNPMMITGVLMLAEPMSLPRLKRVVEKRFLDYARFRQKAVDTPAGASWRDDEHFDLDWHVQLSALPGRGDKRQPQKGNAEKRALERFVSQLASSPLDKSKPLWQFHLIEHYHGGSALVARIHHSYADGIALVQVLLSLTDTAREPGKAATCAKTWLKQDGDKVARRVGAVERYTKLGGKVLEKGMEMYRDPTLAGMLAKEGGEIARELRACAGPAGRSAFDAARQARRRQARRLGRTARPRRSEGGRPRLRLHGQRRADGGRGRRAARLHDRTRRERRWDDAARDGAGQPAAARARQEARQPFRPGVPRSAGRRSQPDPARRARRRVHESTEELAASHCCIWTSGRAWHGAAAPVQELALELFSRKATAVATNVPGPQQPLYLAGCMVREMMFWVPQTGSIGVGISILSYNGRVHFGLIADAKLVPDPDAVIRRFGPEFDKLLYLSLMGNWDNVLDSVAAESMLA